jgi:hypothetical protein
MNYNTNELIKILSQFVKPPSDTLLRYFNMFHLAPSPSSLQFRYNKYSIGITKLELGLNIAKNVRGLHCNMFNLTNNPYIDSLMNGPWWPVSIVILPRIFEGRKLGSARRRLRVVRQGLKTSNKCLINMLALSQTGRTCPDYVMRHRYCVPPGCTLCNPVGRLNAN